MSGFEQYGTFLQYLAKSFSARYTKNKGEISHAKKQCRNKTVQNHVYAAKDFRRKVETGNFILYRRRRCAPIWCPPPPFGRDYGILFDQAAARIRGRWIFASTRLPRSPSACRIYINGIGRKFSLRSALYESMGREKSITRRKKATGKILPPFVLSDCQQSIELNRINVPNVVRVVLDGTI